MKTQAITIISKQNNPELENAIQKKDAEIKESVRMKAKHFGLQNLPEPIGDNLANFIGEIKSSYEKLAAFILHELQPIAHFPEAKIEAEHFREEVSKIDTEIQKKENQNRTDQFELGGFNPGIIPTKILGAFISSLIIYAGEVIYNTKSFQLIVENLLFAIGLSIAISFSVLVASHITAFQLKEAKTRLRKLTIIIFAFIVITVIFIILATLRSKYLAGHDVYLNPIYFVIINLFFFIISTLLSFYILPTWTEVKLELRHVKLQQIIKKRIQEIETLKNEKVKIGITILERTKYRIRVGYYTNYTLELVRKMYFEAIEIYKETNRIYRNDRKTPDCFSQIISEPNIEDVTFTFISQIKK